VFPGVLRTSQKPLVSWSPACPARGGAELEVGKVGIAEFLTFSFRGRKGRFWCCRGLSPPECEVYRPYFKTKH